MPFITCEVGALSNASRVIGLIPSTAGAVTFKNAILSVGTTGGTTAPDLVDLGTAGTAVSKVIATGGTIAGLAAFQSLTMSSAVVEAGHYIGLREGNSGALPTVSIISCYYEEGK